MRKSTQLKRQSIRQRSLECTLNGFQGFELIKLKKTHSHAIKFLLIYCKIKRNDNKQMYPLCLKNYIIFENIVFEKKK